MFYLLTYDIYFATRWQHTLSIFDIIVMPKAHACMELYMFTYSHHMFAFMQASEGYFSQSQEEDFAQSEDCTAKVNPTPVFYNKPPGEIAADSST